MVAVAAALLRHSPDFALDDGHERHLSVDRAALVPRSRRSPSGAAHPVRLASVN
jgi:hypothetical protein